MPPRKRLHAVTASDAPAVPEKPKTLIEAVESGSYLEILVAQRRQMVDDVKSTTGPALAALHRQIALHSKEIAGLKAEAEQEASESAEAADEPFSAKAL